MKNRFLVLLCSLAIVPPLFSACGGSDGSSATTAGAVDASNVSNVSGTFNALEGLLFDASDSSGKLSTRAQANGPTVGSKSRLGCHYKVDRDRMFSDVDRVRVPLCYLSNVEEQNSDFVIGEEEYKYYEIQGAGGDKGSGDDAGQLRVGKFTTNGKTCLRYQMCNGGTSPKESFEVCEIEGGVTADVRHEFNDDFGQGSGSILITALGESKDDLTSMTIESAQDGTFEQGSSAGSAILTANKADEKNTFIGRFSNSFGGQSSNENGVCVYAGGGVGSGRVEGTFTMSAFKAPNDLYYCPDPSNNGFPVQVSEGASCGEVSFDHTESFEIVAGTPPQCLVIADEDSPFSTDVASCEIPTDPVAPSALDSDWDCSGDFVSIDMSALDITECMEIEEKQREREDGHRNCDEEVFQEEQEQPR